jgi:hypothetical protein
MRKIAAKVLKRLNKSTTNNVVDLKAYRQQKTATEDLFKQVITAEAAVNAGYDPLHAVYIHTQNLLSILVEALQAIPEPALSRIFNTVEAADDTYVPSSPPMSPLTKSYFSCWLLFDMSIGLDKETLATIIIDLAKPLGLHPTTVGVMQVMQDSRMGIYELMGRQGNKILLRELTGNEVVACICPAGYRGKQPGELWLVRVLPPVLAPFDYSVIFTTPYVLLSPDKTSWEAYLNRTISAKKTRTTANSLENLLKYGLSDNYWHEYIFQAYVNYKTDVIYLQGLPDISSSRPHHTDAPNFASLLPDSPLS